MKVLAKPIPVMAFTCLLVLCLATAALTGPAKPNVPLTADTHREHGIKCGACHPGKISGDVDMEKTCLSCHGTYDDVVYMTSGANYNPHVSHMGKMECSDCHRAHKPSIDGCAACHGSEYLSDTHIGAGVGCSSCHEKSADKKTQGEVKRDSCLGCHGPLDELAAKTMDLDYNPHFSHASDIHCIDCHHAHTEQENRCLDCHY